MTTIRTLLTNDHRQCDDRFVAVEHAVGAGQLAAAAGLLADFQRAMQAHFACEESQLFPAFEAATGMSGGPTEVMRQEHMRMRAMMDDAVDALADGDADGYLAIADALLIMMQQHNMKEENVLYPMCDKSLADGANGLVSGLQAQLTAA
jgi:hemerythrin-like domain-containing protein